jgi:hypothetical protein
MAEQEAMNERIRNWIGLLAARDEVLDRVLRGHLLIEESLDLLIQPYLSPREALEKARLSFPQKLTLAQALAPEHGDAQIWKAITKLNVLRNKVAHQLDTKQRDGAVRGFVDEVMADLDEGTGQSYFQNAKTADQLTYGIAWILGGLSSIVPSHERMGRLLQAVPATMKELSSE